MTHERRSAPLSLSGHSGRPVDGPRDRSAVAVARRLLMPGGVLLLAASVVSYVAVVDPNAEGHYPTCPFLAHGHVREAFGLNVFAIAMLPVLAFFWVRWTVARALDRPTRTKASDPRLTWALFTGIVLFWLVRNLPFGAFLAA